MLRRLLKSKIHRAKVKETNLDYEGSITIDQSLMEAADILPGEELLILDLNNGERFATYAIKGERDSGAICLNGPSARLVQRGDEVTILSYSIFNEEEAEKQKPIIIKVDGENRIVRK
ncbi:Aspartate 1-decarboxylase [subsurface metagenome]